MLKTINVYWDEKLTDKENLQKRLNAIRDWILKNEWHNPNNSAESNGYDAALKEEMAFLSFLLNH